MYDLTVPTITYKGEGGKPHWTKEKSKARHSSRVCLSLGLWVTNDRGKALSAFKLPTPHLSLRAASAHWWGLVAGRREAAHSWWSENQGPQAHKYCTVGKTLWPQVSGFKNRKGETSTEQIWNQSMEVEWITPNPAFSDTYCGLCEQDCSFPWECFCHFVIMLHMVGVVGEEPSRGHQRTDPTEEEKGAKTGDRPGPRRGHSDVGQAVSLPTILSLCNSQGPPGKRNQQNIWREIHKDLSWGTGAWDFRGWGVPLSTICKPEAQKSQRYNSIWVQRPETQGELMVSVPVESEGPRTKHADVWGQEKMEVLDQLIN